jgi:hypothetical protein
VYFLLIVLIILQKLQVDDDSADAGDLAKAYLSRAEERAKNRSKSKAPQSDVEDDDTEDDPDKKQDDKKQDDKKQGDNQ